MGHSRNRRVALLFMVMVAAVNLRGVGESVKLNVVLTIVEITGLMLVIFVGFWAFTRAVTHVDFSRVIAFDTAEDKNAFLAVTTATSLAFFAMVGFEDSVNMAEETKDPVQDLPEDAVDRTRHRGRRLHRGRHRGGGTGSRSAPGGQRDAARRGGQGRGARSADRDRSCRSSRCSPSPTPR